MYFSIKPCISQSARFPRTFWLGKLIMKTSSGFIAVWGFAERDKVFELISQKIIARQAENTASAQPELPEI